MSETAMKLYKINASGVILSTERMPHEQITYEGYWNAHDVPEAWSIFFGKYANHIKFLSISVAEVKGCERSKGISGTHQVV